MAGAHEVSLPFHELLVTLGSVENEFPFKDVAPVLALAAVIWQTLEQRREVGVGRVGFPSH